MKITISRFAKGLISSAVISAAFMASGCVSLLPPPIEAPSIYRLTQPSLSVAPLAGSPSVRVDAPGAVKALQGTDVVVSPDGRRLAYASGARWASPIPKLLQDAALQSLEQHESVTAIALPTAARADYALEMNIRSFEAAFDQGETSAPMTKIRISATLTELKGRKVIAKREIYAEQRASEARVSSIVSALDSITQSAMTDMSDWVVTSVAGPQSGS